MQCFLDKTQQLFGTRHLNLVKLFVGTKQLVIFLIQTPQATIGNVNRNQVLVYSPTLQGLTHRITIPSQLARFHTGGADLLVAQRRNRAFATLTTGTILIDAQARIAGELARLGKTVNVANLNEQRHGD